MGRKRTSVKSKILISVDTEIIEDLRELKVNRSELFTNAAVKYLEKARIESECVKKGLD